MCPTEPQELPIIGMAADLRLVGRSLPSARGHWPQVHAVPHHVFEQQRRKGVETEGLPCARRSRARYMITIDTYNRCRCPAVPPLVSCELCASVCVKADSKQNKCKMLGWLHSRHFCRGEWCRCRQSTFLLTYSNHLGALAISSCSSVRFGDQDVTIFAKNLKKSMT